MNSSSSPLQDAVEVVRGVLDPVVGDPALGEVVGADLLGPLAAADLGLALGGDLRLLFGDLLLEQSRPQHPHRLVAVLQLGLLVLHRDDDPGRFVGDPHRRVGRVDRLAARPGGAVDVDLEVVLVDLDVDLLGLGQHRDRRGRGVDPPLALGLRHPLDAVRAALELEDRVGALAAHFEGDLLEAARLGGRLREDVGGEAAQLGVAGQHLVEVAGEERRLVAAGAGADLDDHVLLVVRVPFDHRQADLLFERLEPRRAPRRPRRAFPRPRPRRAARAPLRGRLSASRTPPPGRGRLSARRYSRPTSA